MNKQDTQNTLRAVHERGERCRDCVHKVTVREPERLPGRRTEYTSWRGCAILESQNYNFARDPEDCPGVEDKLARKRR